MGGLHHHSQNMSKRGLLSANRQVDRHLELSKHTAIGRLCFGDKHCERGPHRHHSVNFSADGNKPVDSIGHRPCRVHARETIRNSRVLAFPKKSVTKVYSSMLLALRTYKGVGGCQFSRKKVLRNVHLNGPQRRGG